MHQRQPPVASTVMSSPSGMTSSPVFETVQPVVNVTVPPAITAERNAAWSHGDSDVSTRAGATRASASQRPAG